MDIKYQLTISSFYITYVLLMTTGTITFIEALRTPNPIVRHIMNIETCISIIAAFFYYQFIDIIKDYPSLPLPHEKINVTRYTDWFITTPFMLLSLCIFLSHEHKLPLHATFFVLVVALNYGMLVTGYLGELKVIPRMQAGVLGFVFFFAVFLSIWATLFKSTSSIPTIATFVTFASIWSMYGIVYFMDEVTKNVAYNILDVTAKCLIGIFFWMYYTNILMP